LYGFAPRPFPHSIGTGFFFFPPKHFQKASPPFSPQVGGPPPPDGHFLVRASFFRGEPVAFFPLKELDLFFFAGRGFPSFSWNRLRRIYGELSVFSFFFFWEFHGLPPLCRAISPFRGRPAAIPCGLSSGAPSPGVSGLSPPFSSVMLPPVFLRNSPFGHLRDSPPPFSRRFRTTDLPLDHPGFPPSLMGSSPFFSLFCGNCKPPFSRRRPEVFFFRVSSLPFGSCISPVLRHSIFPLRFRRPLPPLLVGKGSLLFLSGNAANRTAGPLRFSTYRILPHAIVFPPR